MIMKKIILSLSLVLIAIAVFSQEITVNFTGRLNDSQYQRLDSVWITDVTRGWTETLVYPDTVIVVNATVNVSNAEMSAVGFEQNVPNPFDCYTMVELAVPQDENVLLQLFDAAGKQCAELNVALNAGSHRFEITASKPQTYILKAMVGAKTYSVRMINVGSAGCDGIKYSGYAGLNAKLTVENEFQVGDDMEFVGYATIVGTIVESENVSMQLRQSQDVVLSFRMETTGTINGHEWVDLGLPSGTRWATCNVGSTTPEGYGDYFAWGETTTKSLYNEDNYTYTDNPITLPMSADAATVNWGAGWRMPTQEEMNELRTYCDITWSIQNGIEGTLFTGINGNNIFLPNACARPFCSFDEGNDFGNYWSSSLYSNNMYAEFLEFCSDRAWMNSRVRYFGLSIRPVCTR